MQVVGLLAQPCGHGHPHSGGGSPGLIEVCTLPDNPVGAGADASCGEKMFGLVRASPGIVAGSEVRAPGKDEA